MRQRTDSLGPAAPLQPFIETVGLVSVGPSMGVALTAVSSVAW